MSITKHSKILLSLISILFVSSLFTACTQQDNKVKNNEWPNKAAENAQIAEKYKSISEDLSKDAVAEFMDNITKIPRTPGNEQAIKNYIKILGKNHNYNIQEDKSGCLYFDIAATPGCENYPKIIMQSHLDMVGTTADGNIDMKTTPVDAVFNDQDKSIASRDNKTTIGADDGEGIVTMLAIAGNKNIVHGPLRFIFTIEEETTMNGAKNLSPEIIDAPYLINIDMDLVGKIIESSGGGLIFELDSTEPTESVTNNFVSIKVDGLKGGHSGVDITRPRMNAHDVLKNILSKLSDESIKYNLVMWNGGTATNSITPNATVSISVDAQDVDKIKSIAEEVFNNMKEKYTDDKEGNIDIQDSGVISTFAFSQETTQSLLKTLKEIPQGVIKENPESSEIPITSCNVGVIDCIDGHVHAGIYFRSAEEDAIIDMNSKLENLRDTYNVKYNIINRFPAWPKNENNLLVKKFEQAYREASNLEPYKSIVHAGLECSFFYQKNPNLQVISIGADVKDEHSATETFYTKSLPAHFAAILHVLENINETKEG